MVMVVMVAMVVAMVVAMMAYNGLVTGAGYQDVFPDTLQDTQGRDRWMIRRRLFST